MSAVRKKRKVVSLKKTSAYSNYKKQAKHKNNHKGGKPTAQNKRKATSKPQKSKNAAPKAKGKPTAGRRSQTAAPKPKRTTGNGPLHLSLDIGIDLGTSSIVVYVKGRGIVFNEPAVVAIDKENGEVVAVGNAARSLLKTAGDAIEVIRPLRNGVIADYDVTEKMLQYFIEQAYGRNWVIKPRIMLCLPYGATPMEQKAIKQAALQSGARQAFLMEKPMAAAMGVGLNVHGASGNMIVDIGGGTTTAAVIALDGIVCGKTILCGGTQMNEAIINHIRREHGLLIGEHCAEDIKCSIGTAVITEENKKNSVQVKGKDMQTGKTKTVTYTAKECNLALMETLTAIINTINDMMEQISPELTSDIIAKGLVLTGGGCRLNNLALLISQKTLLHVSTAEEPELVVAQGTGKALEMLGRISSTGYFARKTLKK
ncbi:MAG: rod shape-determining protein [Bacillota bacterium]|jgi:rod shape-determining protein MreB